MRTNSQMEPQRTRVSYGGGLQHSDVFQVLGEGHLSDLYNASDYIL